jgi:hypothetical protein
MAGRSRPPESTSALLHLGCSLLGRALCRLRVANAEMLSVMATRRLVRGRAGRSRSDCRKSGMWRIAASDKIDRGHAEFGGPGQNRSAAPVGPQRALKHPSDCCGAGWPDDLSRTRAEPGSIGTRLRRILYVMYGATDIRSPRRRGRCKGRTTCLIHRPMAA